MVNDMRTLLHDAAASPPDGDPDLTTVLREGRRRVRRRRAGVVGGLAAAAVTAVAVGSLTAGTGDEPDRVAGNRVPGPEGPTLRLADARAATEGVDYDVLASHTNKDLLQANGQYYDGVTDDGLVLFRDGPHGDGRVRYALLDPATGERTRLPQLGTGAQLWPVHLGADRLVLAGTDSGADGGGPLRAHVFDRESRAWSTMTWPGLPDVDDPFGVEVGPGGRLYVGVLATAGSPPPGGWPTGPDGEADDAAAEGETHDLWSVSLDDRADARDEGLQFGALAFTDEAMVWTETTNGVNDRVHVRDLATGEEHDFDPGSGERCNLLSFGATGDRIVLGQYCGTYDDGRDDRVQVVTTEGEPVTTIQGDGIDGHVVGGLVKVTSHHPRQEGAYVYEPDGGDFVRVTDAVSSWALGGPAADGYLLWDTPYGEPEAAGPDGEGLDQGATQWLVRWRD